MARRDKAEGGGSRTRREPPVVALLAEPEADAPPEPRPGLARRLLRGLLLTLVLGLGLIALLAVVNPPTTPYIWSESQRLGGVDRTWVAMDRIAPAMARAAVAAEDAGFCAHWGLDLAAIRAAMAQGGDRGASTISQQVVKNVYLWQGRSWTRKALEAGITPIMEAVLTKRRILEVYLNVAEFGEGTFGVEAAAQRWFGVPASDLTDVQAARLAAILPSPKTRDPAHPTEALRSRARKILDGAATIEADGRAACFEAAP